MGRTLIVTCGNFMRDAWMSWHMMMMTVLTFFMISSINDDKAHFATC